MAKDLISVQWENISIAQKEKYSYWAYEIKSELEVLKKQLVSLGYS
jgi:hypothetical protein